MSVHIADEAYTLTLLGKGIEQDLRAKLRKQLIETVLEPMVEESVKDLVGSIEMFRRYSDLTTEVHVHLKRPKL